MTTPTARARLEFLGFSHELKVPLLWSFCNDIIPQNQPCHVHAPPSQALSWNRTPSLLKIKPHQNFQRNRSLDSSFACESPPMPPGTGANSFPSPVAPHKIGTGNTEAAEERPRGAHRHSAGAAAASAGAAGSACGAPRGRLPRLQQGPRPRSRAGGLRQAETAIFPPHHARPDGSRRSAAVLARSGGRDRGARGLCRGCGSSGRPQSPREPAQPGSRAGEARAALGDAPRRPRAQESLPGGARRPRLPAPLLPRPSPPPPPLLLSPPPPPSRICAPVQRKKKMCVCGEGEGAH
ncbi:hypothetical protein H8959_012466 [Pygathrix nigripes]